MTNILDELDVIKNIESIYESNSAFNVLKDLERVLDELDIYVYKNWEDGELAEGPAIDRHWVTAKFMWPQDKMPDPEGGKRLLDYDCKIGYQRSSLLKPRKILEPEDVRQGTRFGKLDRHPIWIVEVKMPKKLLADMYGAEFDDIIQNKPQDAPEAGASSAELEDQAAPEVGAEDEV